MTDYENKEFTNTPEPTYPGTAPVPSLTVDPDPVPPVDPVPEMPAAETVAQQFQMPEPPQAPEPPVYTAPAYDPAQYAPQYGAPQQPQAPPYGQPVQPGQKAKYAKPLYNVPPAGYQQKSRLAAALLALLFGTFGIHNYYLGNNTRGTIQLVVALAGGLLTCGLATVGMGVWGFVEGILLLTCNPNHMHDGNGVILKD